MTHTSTDDQPGFMAEEPEHCFACSRLIRPGQTYYLTIEQEVLCEDCALDNAPRWGHHRGGIRVKAGPRL
jgi:hypothetical protein